MRNNQAKKLTNAAVWIAQLVLASSLVWASYMKLLYPKEVLAAMWLWTADHPELAQFTGLADLIVGLGLIVPHLFRIRRKLTVYAAFATVGLMLAASLFHILRGESSQIGPNFFFLAAAAWVGYSRQKQLQNTRRNGEEV